MMFLVVIYLAEKVFACAKSREIGNDGASLSHRARFVFLAVIYLAKKYLRARSEMMGSRRAISKVAREQYFLRQSISQKVFMRAKSRE